MSPANQKPSAGGSLLFALSRSLSAARKMRIALWLSVIGIVANILVW